MSNSLSIGRKKIGFFCYKCSRDDFGNNQKSLSAHVQHCFFDPYSNSQSKRKSHNGPTSLHSSGTSPYPFLVKKTRVSGNDASGMDDVVQYECDNSDEIQNAAEQLLTLDAQMTMVQHMLLTSLTKQQFQQAAQRGFIVLLPLP